jgi:alkylated DNA repair dioxygenase AlkB
LQSGSSIASISFGATRTFRIRDYKTKKIIKDQTLNHGSLFIMGGDFQKEYTHEVPKTKKQITKRINITCRSFK